MGWDSFGFVLGGGIAGYTQTISRLQCSPPVDTMAVLTCLHERMMLSSNDRKGCYTTSSLPNVSYQARLRGIVRCCRDQFGGGKVLGVGAVEMPLGDLRYESGVKIIALAEPNLER